MRNKLPSYKKPPVAEVVVGVQYETIENFSAPHLGVLWDHLDRNKFPKCEEVVPLGRHDQENKVIILSKPALPRIWFKSKDETSLVQFQRDRFLYNWRKLTSKKPYPRYGEVIKKFFKNYTALEACLDELKLPHANVELLELTYINLIPLSSFGGLVHIGKIFRDVRWAEGRKKSFQPSKCSFLWQFNIQNNNSLLNVHMAVVQETSTGEEMLRVELAVRGQAPDPRISNCKKWFDLSREAIVIGFTDLTTDYAHKLWRRYE